MIIKKKGNHFDGKVMKVRCPARTTIDGLVKQAMDWAVKNECFGYNDGNEDVILTDDEDFEIIQGQWEDLILDHCENRRLHLKMYTCGQKVKPWDGKGDGDAIGDDVVPEEEPPEEVGADQIVTKKEHLVSMAATPQHLQFVCARCAHHGCPFVEQPSQ